MIPSLAYVAARTFNAPLLVHAGKAADFAAALGPRILGASVTVRGAEPRAHVAHARDLMGELGDPLSQWVDDRDAFYRVGAVGVIPIEGTLVHKGSFIGSYSGDTSYEGLHRQVNAARRDPLVRGVVFEVDSCGGEVSGVFDCAEAIFELSAEKPTIAILTDVAFSAGYLLAAATRQIVIPETGGAGSIGVIAMHADFSGALEKDGVAVTIIKAGEHKADGNSFQALPADVASRWQAELERTRRQFAETVGRFRGSRLTTEAALATEADCFTGIDAVKTGLADAVGRPSETFAAFCAAVEGEENDPT
jgi:signal peptide peptidase SppA